MESIGSVSMAYPLATIERIPSMPGSSGALSAPTEAESEMTDEGVEDAITPRQTYFMCFATDLLSAYEQIKKRGLTGAKAIDDLCVMIKTRVGLEETYAKGLEKTANQAFKDGLEPGTFGEGLEGLRSDLINKAVQHRQLAKNLTTDVLEPLSELRGQLSMKSKVLISRAYKLQRDTRALDEKYRRSHLKYQRCHREAAACLTAAVEGGAVPRIGSRHKHASSSSTGSPEPKALAAGKAVGGSTGPSPPQAPSLSQPLSESPPQPQGVRRRTMSVTLEKVREAMPSGSNKKDLVQWFLPSEKNRKEALIESAQQGADAAEEARRACRACWIALRAGIHNAAKEFQKVVTDFQWCEEQLVSEAQDAMRKHVVFESSTLANQQYDLQMLFKVMESVNVEIDLRNFIRSARREVANDAAVAAQVALAAENEAPEAMVTATATEVKATKAAAATSTAPATAEAEKISEAAVTGVLVTNGNGSADGGCNRGGRGGWGGQGRASVGAFAGSGVLSSRADSRATTLAFQRLFGVGPDLPAPPTTEAWVPPEVEGESPLASLQSLADLFRVPLMTKEDISKYLDATDPAAGAAASESAAAAIKALGSSSAPDNTANDWRTAATKDAQTDAALAKLPSPYPMVTPASSVFEVLGFAAQARHAENYASIVATAASHGSLGGEAVKALSGNGTEGTGLGGLGTGTTKIREGSGDPGYPRATAETPTEESSKSAVAVTTPLAAVAAAASTAATAAAAAAETAALAIVDGGSGAGSKDCGAETPSLTSGTTSTSLSAVGSDGMSSIFAAAAAAFGAADTPKPPPPARPILCSSSPLTPALTSTRAAGGEGVGTSTGRVLPPGSEAAESTRAAEAPQAADGSSSKEGDDSGMGSLAVAPSYSAASRAPDPVPPVSASTPVPSATAKTNSGCKSASPSLLLVSERPSVFAATLADDVLESLYADGAGATEGDREPGEPSDGDDCEDDFDPAAAVARAVEALIGGRGEALDSAEVDAAEKACRESASSSSKVLLALCERACACAASPPGGPSSIDGAYLGGVVGKGFTPILLPPESFAGLARLLRASLDQANSGREFLEARNCLVASGLYAVRGADYVAWLRAAEATTASGGLGGGGGGGDVLAVMADSELVSAAGVLDRQNRLDSLSSSTAGGESAGDREDFEPRGRRVASGGRVVGKDAAATDSAGAGSADYLLQRELRRHPVWRTIELWEVSMSDSVVMAVGGGGSRAERWLPADTLSALDERFGDDAAGRQLDLKLGQLASLGHSMLACGMAPFEVRSLVRKCSSLAMEIPSADLEALMAALNTFVVGPRPGQSVALSDRPRSGNFQASRLPHPSSAVDGGNPPEPSLDFDEGASREGHSRGIDVEDNLGSSGSGRGGDGDAGDRDNGGVTGSEDDDDESRSSGSSESSRSDATSGS